MQLHYNFTITTYMQLICNSIAIACVVITYYKMELHFHLVTSNLCTLEYMFVTASSSHGDYLEIETMDVYY